MNLLYVVTIIFPSYDLHCYRDQLLYYVSSYKLSYISLQVTGNIFENCKKILSFSVMYNLFWKTCVKSKYRLTLIDKLITNAFTVSFLVT